METHELKGYIYSKFRTLRDCADALGIDESTLSRNLKNPTIAFLQRLRSLYIHIPKQPIEMEKSEVYNAIKDQPYMEALIKANQETIQTLREEVKKKDDLINYFRDELEKKETLIVSLNNILSNMKNMATVAVAMLVIPFHKTIFSFFSLI